MIMGIDTSCYTTSVSLIDDDGKIVLDKRHLLRVDKGGRGLQQSAAIFQHLGNLPVLVEDLEEKVKLTAVIASASPRPQEQAYLPVFRVAASFGATFSRLVGVPYLETTHQEGHIRAGLYGHEDRFKQPFLAWHISGGTTELLLVEPLEYGFKVEIIGGTTDLQAGQFVDRVGVAMGTSFPAGMPLECLAMLSDTQETLPVVSKGLTVSFSGPESAAQRMIVAAGADNHKIARMLYNCLSQSLYRATKNAVEQYGIKEVLFVGGVASSKLFRELMFSLTKESAINIAFGNNELSGDNAVGVGLIGYDAWKRGKIDG